ncbi:DUF1127 domain-containing protein [Thalassospira sp.]|uniref:DUF1127 domain-containing protein n=1 Tax=Thalassospira sp. TaxID=1912094 RepID=UPI0032F05B9C
MVNCNDTIQLPDIRVNNRAVMNGKQGTKSVTWRSAMVGVAVSIVEYLARLQAHARNRHAIQMLDNNMLKDIGLTRADIDNELSKPFWTGLPPRG